MYIYIYISIYIYTYIYTNIYIYIHFCYTFALFLLYMSYVKPAFLWKSCRWTENKEARNNSCCKPDRWPGTCWDTNPCEKAIMNAWNMLTSIVYMYLFYCHYNEIVFPTAYVLLDIPYYLLIFITRRKMPGSTVRR